METILIIEDSERWIRLLVLCLKNEFELVTASSIVDGLHAINENKDICLVLSDSVFAPTYQELKCLDQKTKNQLKDLTGKNGKIPLVIYSSYSPDTGGRFQRLGARKFISKVKTPPFKLAPLLRRELLQLH